MKPCLRLSTLEQHLQEVKTFENPKVHLEQYQTAPHLAACMLHSIQSLFGDIEGKLVADLGCGCGILSVGAILLGSVHCVGFDIDQDALNVFLENKEDYEFDNCEAVKYDIRNMDDKFNKKFDTVIMNPPFGTRCKGIDVEFIKAGIKLANVIYSLHKTSTRSHIQKKAKEWGLVFKVIAELRFDLPATYKFHSKKSVDIHVDLYQFKCI